MPAQVMSIMLDGTGSSGVSPNLFAREVSPTSSDIHDDGAPWLLICSLGSRNHCVSFWVVLLWMFSSDRCHFSRTARLSLRVLFNLQLWISHRHGLLNDF